MTDLNRALVDIRSIRRQVAETSEFRGYGPLTLSITAMLAAVAGFLQSRWLPAPTAHPTAYVTLWLTTAVLCALLIAFQASRRTFRMHRTMAVDLLFSAGSQFLPAAICGSLLPFVLLHAGASAFWMLPGLWQIVCALGIFASCRSMPRIMLVAGAWFLLTGFCCLWLGDGRALSPIPMAGAFTCGMAFVAAVHHHTAKKAQSFDDEDL